MKNEHEKHDKTSTTAEQVYELVREVGKRGELVCIFTDLDDTVLVGKDAEKGYAPGDDPRRVEILPVAARALQDITHKGGVVGVITNRGGHDAANYLRASGISQSYIMGTYGWERYTMDNTSADADEVAIDDRFRQHAPVITRTLHELRNRVYDAFGQPTVDDGANILIPTHRDGVTLRDQSPLIIQQKGVSAADGFPLGLANIYNFNLMKVEDGNREKLKNIVESTYEATADVKGLWGMGGDAGNPQEMTRFTRGFEPLIKEGKAYAMIEMIRKIEETNKKIGLVIFSGDSNADADAMRAATVCSKTLRYSSERSERKCCFAARDC
jgi:hypothetical protein